jgi:predicted glycoside hydrolase/deacetylase ChbG (UPF0249 family)
VAGDRYLIVNADDFGRSRGVNRGVGLGHERGIVTSASLMVRWPAAAEAAAYVRERPGLGVGLHVDLGEWAYRPGGWVPVYEVVPCTDAEAVEREVAAQLETFRLLTGGDPTHLDSHQHVHRSEPVASVLSRLAAELDVPLRDRDPRVRHLGSFYGQTGDGKPLAEALGVEALLALLEGLPAGWTELGCHPGEDDDELDSTYRLERVLEVRALCDARVLSALDRAGIGLRSFADLRPTRPSAPRPGDAADGPGRDHRRCR